MADVKGCERGARYLCAACGADQFQRWSRHNVEELPSGWYRVQEWVHDSTAGHPVAQPTRFVCSTKCLAEYAVTGRKE